MKDIKSRFTKWYVEKGYRFTYAFVGFDFSTEDLSMKYLKRNPNPIKEIFSCPWWVRPFLCFFSPSVYLDQMFYKKIQTALEKDIIDGINEGKANTKGFLLFTQPPAPIKSLVDDWDKIKPLPELHVSHKNTKIFVSRKSGSFMCCDEYYVGQPFIPYAVINVKEEEDEND